MSTIQSIERVCDKRHARMCVFLPEHEAAARVAAYLVHLQVFWHDCPRILYFINHIKSAYALKLEV